MNDSDKLWRLCSIFSWMRRAAVKRNILPLRPGHSSMRVEKREFAAKSSQLEMSNLTI